MLGELGEELTLSKSRKGPDANAEGVRTPDTLEADDRVNLFASPDISLIISQDIRQAMEERQRARDRVKLMEDRDDAINNLLLQLNQETDEANNQIQQREKRIGDIIIQGSQEKAENLLVVAEGALSAAQEVLPDQSGALM